MMDAAEDMSFSTRVKGPSGNPRVTYNLCSAVEDALLADQLPGTELVDDIVRQMYLGSIHLPPSDHIKDSIDGLTDCSPIHASGAGVRA
ncbi:hypothetical protein AWB78_03926 [Caballeronia calidae]|uniref:Uncharacterized protein n=1 Tax=Caballeronia calidae TaxID=1777139 RepID=A0A158CJ95_9BURK|nr:hypothetical protein AWB78_03926 [Caballeronia calidae]